MPNLWTALDIFHFGSLYQNHSHVHRLGARARHFSMLTIECEPLASSYAILGLANTFASMTGSRKTELRFGSDAESLETGLSCDRQRHHTICKNPMFPPLARAVAYAAEVIVTSEDCPQIREYMATTVRLTKEQHAAKERRGEKLGAKRQRAAKEPERLRRLTSRQEALAASKAQRRET
ncbi:hypothetical protein LTR22_027751 [Elasticomyces elasticus]|nr:hypothetical protein LTR22_027751 [Elasticomyces elasticus]KAK5732425.1 hypothetical protein LTS12_027126 [Elasticomyces elasticus]